jgi:hypothetical protein
MTPRAGLLRLPFAPPAAAARAVAGDRPRALVLALLLLLLPFFLQSFHYVIDLPLPYLVSKAWPVITLPLSLYALLRLRPGYAALYLTLLAYVLGLTPLLGAVHLGSSFTEAVANAVRAAPFLYAFAFLGFLALLRPREAELRRAFLWLGAASYATLWALWILLPASAYSNTAADTNTFFFDVERGERIVIVMGFALVLLFWMARRAARTRSLPWALACAFCLFTMFEIYKQRLVIALALLILGLTALRALPPRARVLGALAGLGAGLAGGFFWLVLDPGAAGEALGGSLSVRVRSAELAWDFIAADPLRWLFGVGSTTRFSSVRIEEILGFSFFFVTDLGWLGAVMEFGVVGAALILAAYLLSAVASRRLHQARGDDFTGALADWGLVLLLLTAVYPPVYIPGEVACLVALVWYLRWNETDKFLR